MGKQSVNQLIDKFGREHTCLRISVTDQCNLRCFYCMPDSHLGSPARRELLTFQEIVRIASIFARMGICKLRITGGEPLLRPNIEQLIEKLVSIPGIETVGLTTNGVLLADKAQALKASGIKAINISLDSLNSQRFKRITGKDDWDKVIAGVDAALQADFQIIKLNCVVMAGYNEDELLNFVDFARDRALNIRFVEYMPFPGNQWRKDRMFTYARMKQVIEERYELLPINSRSHAVAKDFSITGHAGTVSFITSMSEGFCQTCTRLRLTACGSVKSCLFYDSEINLQSALAAPDEQLMKMICQAVDLKPEARPLVEELTNKANRAMVEIGG